MKEDRTISRRGFLKAAATIGAALTVAPAINKVKAAETAITGSKGGMEHRTLGSGPAAMEVSALGFGCMGMNYKSP